MAELQGDIRSRQRCREGKGYNDPDRMIWVLVKLLRPWIKRFMIIIFTWWLQTSSKLSGQELEEIHTNSGSLETPKQVRIPPCTKVCGSFNDNLASAAVR